jgi:nicotinate-nucleotide adenylyltransferase
VQEACWQLQLDSVMLMPVGEAPHREIEMDAGREARYELCRLATADDERLSVSRHEIDRDGPSFTVETLRALRGQSPGDERFLIVGSDEAVELESWREPEEILKLATIAVAEREQTRREHVTAALAELGGGEGVTFFEMPRIDISSTLVRERIAAGRPIRYLVPAAVAGYIEEAGLYSSARGSVS